MVHPSAAGFYYNLCCYSQSSPPLPLELLKLKPLPTLNKAEYYSRSYSEIETSIPFPSLLTPRSQKGLALKAWAALLVFWLCFQFHFYKLAQEFYPLFYIVFQWENIFRISKYRFRNELFLS